MKKISTIILSLLIFIMPFTACNKNESGLKTVELNEVTHSIFYAPLYVAIENNYFKDEGLNVKLTNGGGADKVMSAILSGNADIGLMGPESAIYVYLEGKTDYPKVFGQLTQKDGSFLVSRTNEPNFKWSDLKNKKILAGRPGGVPAMTFEYVINKNGLYDGVDCELLKNVQFDMMTAAFESGTGDYCTMFEPVASEYQAAGKGYIVASVGEAAGEIPYTSFISKQSYIKKNTDVIKSFLKALKKAYDYMKTATNSEIASVLVTQFPSTSLSSIEKSIESYKKINAWTNDLRMTEDSFNRLQDVISNAGELTNRVDFTKLVDNSYAEAIFN